jgi:Dolichyl-phosphate-mannose-protein mannosyltransferase
LARSRPAIAAQAPALAWWRQLAGFAIWPTLILLAIYIVLYVQFAAQLVSFPFDVDQGEGYDAWSAWLINLGQLPYTSNADFPYYSSNYPPLWSYLVSIPMAWFGPGVAPARIVSTLAALLTAVCLGLAARRLSGSTLAGLLAAGFFVASPYVFHTTPLARVNGTALLFAVVGLTFLERPRPASIGIACLAFLAALFTKQTTLDAVAAGVLFLLVTRWRTGVATGIGVGGLGMLGLGALVVLTGGAFWLNVVSGNAQPFDPGQLEGYLLNFGMLHCVLLALAGAETIRAVRQRNISVWSMYFVTACLATLGVAKWGAGESYFLAAIAAACVLGGCWAARVLEAAGTQTRIALSAALLLQAALLSHGSLSDAISWLPDRGPQGALLGHPPGLADRVEAERLAEQIRLLPGPALAEDPSFAVVAGQGVIGNATHLRNLYQAGLWDPTPMVDDLRSRRYAMVVLNAELYPEPVLAAIGRFYFLDRAVRIHGATYHVFLPGSD